MRCAPPGSSMPGWIACWIGSDQDNLLTVSACWIGSDQDNLLTVSAMHPGDGCVGVLEGGFRRPNRSRKPLGGRRMNRLPQAAASSRPGVRMPNCRLWPGHGRVAIPGRQFGGGNGSCKPSFRP